MKRDPFRTLYAPPGIRRVLACPLERIRPLVWLFRIGLALFIAMIVIFEVALHWVDPRTAIAAITLFGVAPFLFSKYIRHRALKKWKGNPDDGFGAAGVAATPHPRVPIASGSKEWE